MTLIYYLKYFRAVFFYRPT